VLPLDRLDPESIVRPGAPTGLGSAAYVAAGGSGPPLFGFLSTQLGGRGGLGSSASDEPARCGRARPHLLFLLGVLVLDPPVESAGQTGEGLADRPGYDVAEQASKVDSARTSLTICTAIPLFIGRITDPSA